MVQPHCPTRVIRIVFLSPAPRLDEEPAQGMPGEPQRRAGPPSRAGGRVFFVECEECTPVTARSCGGVLSWFFHRPPACSATSASTAPCHRSADPHGTSLVVGSRAGVTPARMVGELFPDLPSFRVLGRPPRLEGHRVHSQHSWPRHCCPSPCSWPRATRSGPHGGSNTGLPPHQHTCRGSAAAGPLEWQLSATGPHGGSQHPVSVLSCR